MKNLFKPLMFTAFSFMISIGSNAQITLDTVYSNGGLRLYMVDLEVSGMKYVVKNDDFGFRSLKFYNLDHSWWKTINCNPFYATAFCGAPGNQYLFDALYISQTLFDCDSAVEFMYVSFSDCQSYTGVFKENGTALLIADSAAPFVKLNVPQQYRPIYNTPGGTKLILSHRNGKAMVYDLPCTLSTGTDQFINPVDDAGMRVYPNPSFYETTIEYKIPGEFNQAELIITDMEGREIRRYQVDNNMPNLLISQDDVQPGTYFYSLVAGSKVLGSKKVIVLK